MNRLASLVFVFCLCPLSSLKAQAVSDSLSSFPEVVISGNRQENFAAGSKVQHMDSIAIRNLSSFNLGDLVSQQSGIFMKSYGYGQISTATARGTNANHTAILWNGFNLQGPTLGQSDFSTIPVFFLDNVDVQYGGGSALFGSGAVGGIVHLNNKPHFGTGHALGLHGTIGSYKNHQEGIRYEWSTKNFICAIRYLNKYGKNDIPLSKDSKEKLSNGAVGQTAVLVENYLKINSSQTVNVRLWFQDLTRQIPSENNTLQATNQNKFYRLTSEWEKAGNRATFNVRSSYFNELYDYKEGESFKTIFQTNISEVEGKFSIAQFQKINVGVNNTYNEAQSLGYENIKVQNRTAAFASYQRSNVTNIYNLTISARQEVIGLKAIPLMPAIGVEVTPIKAITIKSRISRNYRLPTLNDLYWHPNGNKNLQPEIGWSEEIGLTARKKIEAFDGVANLTAFNSNIKNWIIWLPKSGQWIPQNIQSVWSRGIESSLKIETSLRKVRIKSAINYAYTLSTNEKATLISDESLGKQLLYVPIYTGSGELGIEYKSYSISYLYSYTGNRFTTSSNSEYIKGYQLANIIFNKTINLGNFKSSFNFQINNVWNVEYQVVLAHPMPLRNYQLGLNININKPNKL